ncbi:MAG TPA: LutB/LldF family L-lactate oxidation iron-sulfur protein [Verrucomicrobiae bacterium]|nr:LutB/LldF family L-lactate oxidation iron-sulfur protein [Verrucomicrobiae bacterium]
MTTPTLQQFERDATAKTADLRHRAVIQKNIATYQASVARGRVRFADWPNARSRAATIKWDTINHLDRYLEQFETNVLANGGHVFWAETAADARAHVLQLARLHGVKKVVKSKSMTTEEIHLNDALEAAGVRAVETDLGEYICQLRGEHPYHIITPVMHLTKADIAQTFQEKLGTPLTDNAEELTMIARAKLRHEFLTADMGITGGNFAIADTGMIALTENEGNARLTFSLPRVHVAIVGIEKLIPRLEDLALFWPLLADSGTGQLMTAYSSLIGGPRQEHEADGPQEFHVILLDNGRTRLLADAEQRDALHCIRCGACLNACPVYKNIGGHAYGTTYQGPIGSVITPHLRDAHDWAHLPYASSLCGACTDACPVRIDLHHHLLHNRRNAVRRGFDNPIQRFLFRAWLCAMLSPVRYAVAATLGAFALRRGWAGPLLKPWTARRDFPTPPKQSFRDYWRKNERRA